MSQIIEPLNNMINLVRGDYVELALDINDNTDLNPIHINLKDEKYRGYKILFGLMEPNQAFEDSVLYKEYTIDENFINNSSNFIYNDSYNVDLLLIKLYTRDTICLHPGQYFFTVKMENPKSHQLLTIINKSSFNIL